MRTVVKINDRQLMKVKYLLIDNENKDCIVIPDGTLSNKDKDLINDVLEKKLTNYNVFIVDNFNSAREFDFIWPQILSDIKNSFPHVNGWLERAKISIKGKKLKITAESKIAYKNITNKSIINFIKNRTKLYLNEELTIEVENGDFLKVYNISTVTGIKNNVMQNDNQGNNNILMTGKKSRENNIKKTKILSNGIKEIVYGKEIKAKVTHQLEDIEGNIDNLITEGIVFEVDEIKTRKGNKFYIVDITDRSNSITIKIFPGKKDKMNVKLAEGDLIRVKGFVQYDKYSREWIIVAEDINKLQKREKEDLAQDKRIELHLHTKMSAMDAVVDVEAIIKRAADWGHPAIAITDHGVVQAFPDAYRAGQKYGIKIIYGMEAYLVDDGEPIVFNPVDRRIEDTTYIVFDFETTGLYSYSDEIIEIGAVKLKNGKIIEEFGSFVKPVSKIPPKITELTGIDNEMVSNAPQIDEVINRFLDFIGDSVLVAHNATFDYAFLRAALHKSQHNQDIFTVIDTLSLSRAIFPQLKNHRLNTLCNHTGIVLENHHRAVDDARACAQLFERLLQELDGSETGLLEDLNKLTTKIDWKNMPVYHIVILARNKDGLKDLYRLVSTSHLNYFYRKPRVLKSELIHMRDNLLLGSACEAGQLFRGIMENKDDNEIKKIARFYDYLEIQPLGNNSFLINKEVNNIDDLKEINKKIYQLGKKLKKPVVATGDVHFVDPEDEIYRRVLQAGLGYDQAEEQAPLYFRTTEEMLKEFDYLGEYGAKEVVIENPVQIVNWIDELQPIPDGLYTPEIDGADLQIREMTYKKAHQLYGKNLPELIKQRLERELNSIINHGFAVIYLISHKLVKKSLDDGYLVGSRGSVGSSLVATMCDITEVNPLPPHYYCPECDYVEFIQDGNVGVGIDLPDQKCPDCGQLCIKDGFNIPFEVFMGFEGDKVPDIDLNFSGEYQSEIHRHTEELFGREYVFRAGTISTIASRTAFGFVKGFMEDNNYNYNNAEIKRLVKGCTGVRRTTGQHPGGLMVVPRKLDVHNFTPIQYPANDQNSEVRTTHFDYHSISGRILKLDLLGHDDPTSLRMLQDLTGVLPEEIPLDDPETMAIFSGVRPLGVEAEEIGTNIGTLGIPEFGTGFVRQMLMATRPTTFAELVRISGLSHGTDVWLNNAQNLIHTGKAKLSEVISVRDDIMNYLINKGLEPARAFWIMENVRKGKGLKEEDESYMIENGVPEWYIASCKKIKYMFPKAHAAAYVMMAYRIAYFKVHYPEAFYATYFTTKAADFDAEFICQGDDQLLGYKRELEEKGNDLTAKEKNVMILLEIAVEAVARGIKFTKVDLYNSDAAIFKITKEGLLPPLISLQGLGSSAAQNIAATREEGEFLSIEDLVNRTRISKTVVEIMQQHGTLHGLPEKNQLSLFQ